MKLHLQYRTFYGVQVYNLEYLIYNYLPRATSKTLITKYCANDRFPSLKFRYNVQGSCIWLCIRVSIKTGGFN